MNETSAPIRPYADTRKIDPSRAMALRPDNTPDDNDRAEIGPTPLAYREWAEAGIQCPDLPRLRQFRYDRLLAGIRARDYAGLLMFDPLNIRYATDSTNMQVWNAHNPYRACLLLADGHMLLWDWGEKGAFLSDFNPLVKEVRGSAAFFYFLNGYRSKEAADRFAGEIDSILRERCGGNRRLAVDKMMLHGVRAFDRLGIEMFEGEEVTEKARAIKGPDDVAAMRCAIHSTERAMAEMEAAVQPGVTENEVWSYLHAGNIKRGGEWIECRLLASGQRTNPWFQECGPRVLQEGDVVGFDTDLVGPYGYCADISRTWLVGDRPPTNEQKRMYAIAQEHIETNAQLLKPGVTFFELSTSGHMLPEEFVEQRYGAKMHGVGLCDEWPGIRYPEDLDRAYDGVIEPGMVICVEAYIGAVGGRDGIKLEDQWLITESGAERLNNYHFDARLSGSA